LRRWAWRKQITDSTQQALFRKTDNENGGNSGLITALDKAVADTQEEPGKSSLQNIHSSAPKAVKANRLFWLHPMHHLVLRLSLTEAMARTAFNEEFVSVPTIQFASLAKRFGRFVSRRRPPMLEWCLFLKYVHSFRSSG
jgi:hypothetical protein